MKRTISSFIVFVLLVSAATASAQGTPATFARSADYWMKYAGKLPVGSTVRVRTSDGKRMTAVLAIVDETGITLEPKTRVPEPPRHISYEQLDQVELKQGGTSLGKAVGIGVAVGVGSFFGILAILATAWSD